MSFPKTQQKWPRPGREPGPLDLESSALTIRPQMCYIQKINNSEFIFSLSDQIVQQVFDELGLTLNDEVNHATVKPPVGDHQKCQTSLVASPYHSQDLIAS